MKIVLVSDFYYPMLGGIETHVKTLAKQLKTRGHKVTVVTTSCPNKGQEIIDGINIFRLDHILSSFKPLYSNARFKFIPPFPDPLFLINLKHIVDEIRPDVIHSHGWVTFAVAQLKQQLPKLPMVATLHDHGFFCARRTLFCTERGILCPYIRNQQHLSIISCFECSKGMYGYVRGFPVVLALSHYRNLLRKLDVLIQVNHFLTRLTKSLDFNNTVVIPNFTDYNEIQSTCRSTQDAVESDIIFVGSLNPIKGAHILLAAYERIIDTGRSLRLTMITKSESSNIRIPDSVRFLVDLPRSETLYNIYKSKIVVIPSVSPEALSSVALEAMSLKKPIIASDIGGNTEIIVNRETGLLTPAGDSNSLALSILDLLEKPSLRSAMGLNGFNRLLKIFSAESTVPKIENIYREVISRYKP